MNLLTILLFISLQSASNEPVYTAGTGGITAPRLVRDVKPEYTPNALRTKTTGRVLVDGVVELDGSVTNVRVIRSLDSELDAEAVKAFQAWRFLPGSRNGFPVRVRITAQLSFDIADATAPVVVLRRQEQDGTTTVLQMSPERFRQLPTWDPDTTDGPPLPASEAIRVATAWIKRTHVRPEADRFLLVGAAFLRFPDRGSNRWYYQVNFAPVVREGVAAGGLVTVAVLFDGTVVEPQ